MKNWVAAAFTAAFALTSFAADAPLAEAVKSGQRGEALKMIAGQPGSVNTAEADGSTALLWAASLNDADLVRELLKAGANPNVRNKLESTPLAEAAFHANTDMIQALLDAGADPNAAGPDGQTPLMLVARTANVTAAKALLAKGANPNVTEDQRGQTPLMWAAASSQGAMVRALLEARAVADAATATDLMTPLVSGEPRAQPRPPGGMTAMLFAVREGCLECVKALLDHGSKIDLPDPEGVTPLLLSLFNAHFDVAKYLIEKGANVNRWDWWGRTPLYLAIDYSTLPHGGRPDQPAADATLPIDIARMLLERGANPNPQLKLFPPYRATGADRGADGMLTIGATPLLRAAKAQDAEALKLLLEQGAIVDLPNSQGMTPVVAATGTGSSDIDTRGTYRAGGAPDNEDRAIASLEVLLAHGAKINEPAGRQQQVPIHGAAQWGWNKVIEYLLAKGADVNAADSRGLTAVDYAMGRASFGRGNFSVREETAELLTAKGGHAGTPVAPPGGRGGPAGAGGRGGAAPGGRGGAGRGAQ
jgi:ankyrin repeat protein